MAQGQDDVNASARALPKQRAEAPEIKPYRIMTRDTCMAATTTTRAKLPSATMHLCGGGRACQTRAVPGSACPPLQFGDFGQPALQSVTKPCGDGRNAGQQATKQATNTTLHTPTAAWQNSRSPTRNAQQEASRNGRPPPKAATTADIGHPQTRYHKSCNKSCTDGGPECNHCLRDTSTRLRCAHCARAHRPLQTPMRGCSAVVQATAKATTERNH